MRVRIPCSGFMSGHTWDRRCVSHHAPVHREGGEVLLRSLLPQLGWQCLQSRLFEFELGGQILPVSREIRQPCSAL